MNNRIEQLIRTSADVKLASAQDSHLLTAVQTVADELKSRLNAGGTVYLCGNGGSACDAMHFCEELTARFKRHRDGFRAMHFMDGSFLSCWANDYDFQSAYARMAKTFCTSQDLLFGISTSGNSDNVLQAIDAAKANGCYTVGLTGKGGGKLADVADCAVIVPSDETERIQEVHITLIHIWCELLET